MDKEKKIIAGLIVWTFTHIVLWAYGNFSFGEWEPKEFFYPFVKTDFPYPTGLIGSTVSYPHLYTVYDFTEFLIYVGGAWLIFFLYKYLKAK